MSGRVSVGRCLNGLATVKLTQSNFGSNLLTASDMDDSLLISPAL